jgi:hypothetical protein
VIHSEDEIDRYLCRYCGKVIPGEVTAKPCPRSPDGMHRHGQRWTEPEDVTVTSPASPGSTPLTSPASPGLTPYDTGDRLEPQPWGRDVDHGHYGKVDFDNEESATVATVWIEATSTGTYVLRMDTDFEFAQIIINGEESL